MPEPDKYDRAIAYLTEHPDRIVFSWTNADPVGWPLFQYVTPSGKCTERDAHYCGCLTTIRRDAGLGAFASVASTPELTAAILADGRIPDDIRNVTPAHLPIFAAWQRRIDRELGRKAED